MFHSKCGLLNNLSENELDLYFLFLPSIYHIIILRQKVGVIIG